MRFLIDPKDVREVRIRLGLTQEQMAAALCLSRGAIAKWECRPEQPRDGAPAVIVRTLAGMQAPNSLWEAAGDEIKHALDCHGPIAALKEIVCFAHTGAAS